MLSVSPDFKIVSPDFKIRTNIDLKSGLLLILLMLFSVPVFSQTVIPFQLTAGNNLSIKAVINQRDTVNLMFHTAANALTLTETAVKKAKGLVFDRTDSVKSWGGSGNTSRFSKSNTLQIGKLTWENIPIWENTNSGPETDGKFGLELFANKVIEIDFDKKVIILYDQLPRKLKGFEKLKLVYQDDMMFVEGSCEINGNQLKNKFLIHTGYSGSILFDDEFTAKNKIDEALPTIAEKSLKDSFGNILKTKKAILPLFKLGNNKLTQVPIGFFTGAIGRQKMSILGCDVLKRFHIIIDAERSNIYLKVNGLAKLGYWNG